MMDTQVLRQAVRICENRKKRERERSREEFRGRVAQKEDRGTDRQKQLGRSRGWA